MKGTSTAIARLLLLALLSLVFGCTPPAPEPQPAEETGDAITTEDFESGSVESMQEGAQEDEESEAQPPDD